MDDLRIGLDLNDPETKKLMEKGRLRREVLKQISLERFNQDKQWGGDDHDDSHSSHEWVALITKHLGRTVFEPWSPELFKNQMIKVGALVVAAIEWIIRNENKSRDGDTAATEDNPND